MYRQRFGLTGHVFPKDACAKTFTETPSFAKLKRRFKMLQVEPGLGVFIGDAGFGKTTSMRHLTSQLPRPQNLVLYLCDTATSPLDFYRQLAQDLGLRPSHRRAQLWREIKAHITQMVDESAIRLTVVIDEAQHLSDRFLLDLSGFLNFAFDSRNLLTVWLVGQPGLRRRLQMKLHAALASRIAARVSLEALSERADFDAFLEAGLKAAGATATIVSDPACELLFRASRGVPRRIAWLLKESLILAHERDQSFVDDSIVEAVLDEEDF